MAKKEKRKTRTPTKTAGLAEKAHPWRPCLLGEHWVSAHPKNKVSSRGKPFTQHVGGFCRKNPSHLDHLYIDDIHEVASRHFESLTGPPTPKEIGFPGDGNKYDTLIRGWTQYWNEVLKLGDPLDPDVVKALIASESGFNPLSWNRLRGKNGAYGLMQVLNGTIPLLKNSRELRNHLVNLTEDDMKDPNPSICAGIRWLFRKKQILESRAGKQVPWRDVVREYKGYKPTDKDQKGMEVFDEKYRLLKSE